MDEGYTALWGENKRLRRALLVLTEVLEEIIVLLPAEPVIQERLRGAIIAARLDL